MSIKKVAFSMYPVLDMARARKFYEEILGLELGSTFNNDQWVEYDLPRGGCFALTTMAKGVSPSANAGGSVAFEVDDIYNLVKLLKEKGVKFKMDPFESPVCHMAVIIDSEGNALMLHELKRKKS